MPTVGEMIKSRREGKGLSQKRLGAVCGVSDSEILRIESGGRKSPSWNTLCLIAKALDTHPFEFLLVAGYISEEDIHPRNLITGIERLNTSGIQAVQLYVDFLLTRPDMISIPKEEKLCLSD